MRSFALRSMKPLPDTTPTSMNWITILVGSVTLYRESWLSCRQWESPNPIAHLTGKSIRLQLEIIPTTGLPLQTLLISTGITPTSSWIFQPMLVRVRTLQDGFSKHSSTLNFKILMLHNGFNWHHFIYQM